MEITVDVWSDVICPWCYIGKRNLERAIEQVDAGVEVRWHAFELDPGAPRDLGGGLPERLAAKYGVSLEQARRMNDRVTAVAAEAGLEYHLERARPGNTVDAHRLIHLAGERGLGDAMKERLLRAYFVEGEAIADAATLRRLGVEVGLEAAAVDALLDGDGHLDAVREDEAQARALGITGVPFFVVDGRYGVSGAQPPALLRQVLERAMSDRPAAIIPVATGGACDGDACEV